MRHQDALGLLDDGPALHGLGELLAQGLCAPVGTRVGQDHGGHCRQVNTDVLVLFGKQVLVRAYRFMVPMPSSPATRGSDRVLLMSISPAAWQNSGTHRWPRPGRRRGRPVSSARRRGADLAGVPLGGVDLRQRRLGDDGRGAAAFLVEHGQPGHGDGRKGLGRQVNDAGKVSRRDDSATMNRDNSRRA